MDGLTNIEKLLPELRAYAKSICNSSVEADDLVQDAIERALRSKTQPETLADLRPWMFRVVRNLFYDELRKHRVRREYSLGQGRLTSEAFEGPNQERDVLLRLTFEKLSPEFKEVLFLIDVMGMKYIEAAQIMGVPKGTVMSRISRARRTLLELVRSRDYNLVVEKRKQNW